MAFTTRFLILVIGIAGVVSICAQEPKKDATAKFPPVGEIKAIDLIKRTITIEARFGLNKELKTYSVAEGATISRFMQKDDKSDIKLKDLKPGDLVGLVLDRNTQQVARITVVSTKATSRPPLSIPTRGTFKSIDIEKKTVTIESLSENPESKTYPLDDSFEIILSTGPRPLKPADLIIGDELSLTLDPESRKVTRIGVRAARIPTGTIKEIDLKNKFVVISPIRGTDVRLPLADKVIVEKYFRTIPISDLKVGMQVFVSLGEDRKSIAAINISERGGPGSIFGRIKAIDAARRMITIERPALGVKRPEESVSYKLADTAAIKVNRSDARLADLATGMNVTFFAEKDTIVGLSAPFTARIGMIAKVDVKSSSITIKIYDESVICAVTMNTKIRQRLQDVAFADLKEGQEVTFTLSADKKTLESINVNTGLRP